MRSFGAAGASRGRRGRSPRRPNRRAASLACGVAVLVAASILAPVATAGAANAVTFERLWGQDRYETAVEIAEKYVAQTGPIDTVIVASGTVFADALSAAPLAHVLSAPVLLTPPNALPFAVRDFIGKQGVGRAVVIGNADDVSAAVQAELEALVGSVPQRIAGADRDETNLRVAQRVAETGIGDFCGDGRRTVLLATRDRFADALAISPLAYYGRHPVLLSDPQVLASSSRDFLVSQRVAQVIVAGGTAAISAAVLDEIAELGIKTRRWWGNDRYATAAEVAEELVDACFDDDKVGLASGVEFPDALVGGALLGARAVPVVLADVSLSEQTRQSLARTAASSDEVEITVFGGAAAVHEPVVTAAVKVLSGTAGDGNTPGDSAPECTEPPPTATDPISIDPPSDVSDETAPSEIVIEGHGHGHGNGLSQWGALGYATHYGCTGEQIVLHYYGNTTMTDVGARDIVVHLTRNARHDLLVTSPSSFTAEGHSFAGGEIARLGVTDNAFDIHRTSGCADDPGAGIASGMAGRSGRNGDRFIEVLPSSDDYAADDLSQMLTMIYCGGADDASELMRITYRGAVGIVKQSGRPYTFNRLPLEQYLRGVVPKESPPDWGARTGPAGTGLAALEAQAIAARSYALYWSQYQVGKGRFTDICDWPNCQLYEGAAAGNGQRRNDHGDGFDHTTQAVANTEGRALLNADGRFAFTEFSASSGGWSAGPPASTFPAVPDLGDAVYADSGNKAHRWTIKLRRSDIERAFEPLFAQQGKTLGKLVRIDVTRRDGNGAWGGRVRALRVVGTGGEHTFTFDRWARDPFRKAFPRTVLSDWYRFPQFDGGSSAAEPARGAADAHLWVLRVDGAVRAYGPARHYGDGADEPSDTGDVRPVYADIAVTHSGKGYWLLDESGAVRAFGDARHHGDITGQADDAARPVGMTAHPDGGYWVALANGEVHRFGAAASHGAASRSDDDALIVDIESTPSGGGYWLLAADGEVLAFGDATQLGSPSITAAVSIAASADGDGYWVGDAGTVVHAFGHAEPLGSRSGKANRLAMVDMVATDTGDGYWLIWSDGTSFNYGIAPDYPTSRAGPGVVAAASVR